MSKVLLFLSFLSLVILALGTAFMQNNTMFWLADGGLVYKIVIEVMATILFVQIITHPPRHIFFRILAGLVSLLVGIWTIITTSTGAMPLLDSLSLLASATAIGVTALEARPKVKSDKKLNYKQSKASKGNPLIA